MITDKQMVGQGYPLIRKRKFCAIRCRWPEYRFIL
jgi:hypothetical protein